MWVEEAVAKGAELRTEAKVDRVIVEDGQTRGVTYASGGEAITVRAGTVIVSAGWLGTPIILRSSGIDGSGKDFFYAPHIVVTGIVPGLDAASEMPMATGCNFKADGYMLTDLATPLELDIRNALAAGHRVDEAPRESSLEIMVKIRDNLAGAITEDGHMVKGLTEADKARLDAGCQRAEAILREAGAEATHRGGLRAVHPGGTAKIGEIVDNNLRTAVDNLYVCDYSVVPDAWGGPPILTVIALGKRLASHLLENS